MSASPWRDSDIFHEYKIAHRAHASIRSPCIRLCSLQRTVDVVESKQDIVLHFS